MQPQKATDRLRWAEQSLAGIVQHLGRLEAELDALVSSPPTMTEEERAGSMSMPNARAGGDG